MSLLDTLNHRRGLSRQRMVNRYAEILESGDSSLADELLDLVERLAKSKADVEADSKAIAAFKNATDRSTSGRHWNEEHAKATKAYRAETEEIRLQREQRQRELDQELFDLENDARSRAAAERQMDQLKMQHRELLASK